MSNIKLFEEKKIRSVWNESDQKQYFVVEDVVAALTDSNDPKQYVKRMKQRDTELAKGWVQFVPTLSIETPGGEQKMSCANVQGMLRIIQSIPSPKAEPFKLWLAKVGNERLEEIENPELAQTRMREIYRAKAIKTKSPVRDDMFIEKPDTHINQNPVGMKWRMLWLTHLRKFISILFLPCRTEPPLFNLNGRTNYINT